MTNTRLIDSQSGAIVPHRATPLQSAWTVFRDLVKLGRPAPPAELASRSEGSELSPDQIEVLCSVPDSPLELTVDGFVTYAPSSCRVFAESVKGAKLEFDSILRGFGQGGVGREFCSLELRIGVEIESGKQRLGALDGEIMPARKRARLVDLNDDEADDKASGTGNCSTEVCSLIITKKTRSARKHGNGCVMSAASNSPGRGLVRNETLLGHSDAPLPRDVQTVIGCVENEKLGCLVDTTDPAILKQGKSNQIMKSHVTPLPPVSNNMIYNEVASELPLDIRTAESFALVSEIQVGGPHLRVVECTCASMTAPCETCNMSPFTAGSQNIHSPVHCVEKKMDGSCLESNATLTSLCKSKSSSAVSLMPRNGSDMDCSHSLMTGEKKLIQRKCDSILHAADDHVLSKKQKLSCSKTYSRQKGKKPQDLQYSYVPSTISLDRKECTMKPTIIKDIQATGANCYLKEHDHTIAHVDQTKKTLVPTAHLKVEKFPTFESFIVEEEEGSGGYGTVYKARRKSDNEVFAIKCPHPNAHKYYVYNELSMLKRFGGKDFTIRLEDFFKFGNSCCFVLEHVEHDRPEVLKREIDVSQLRWYAYCMFAALATLHKQGIVHRDIKPGNFLFSRQVNIGYLIDFNLALDLHQKKRPMNRPKMESHSKGINTALRNAVHLPNQSRMSLNPINKDTVERAIVKAGSLNSKSPKSVTGRIKASTTSSKAQQILQQSQGGSGVTSIKDRTSTRTPVDRLRQPMPSQGRKELLSLALEAMQSPKNEALRLPTSKSRRIPAPPNKMTAPEKIDRKLSSYSPMPLHSSGIPVAGAGFFSHKGEVKEGPCAGTKGFRAPEVLLRSAHQTTKIDIWSAGVTLLYLMMGKTPFYGDPTENMKDIAKLRGSEDLWEVAKLHNRESAFPMELFDVKFLPSIKLREWCRLHTKRSSIIKEIPNELFDLLEKCLTVNPRLRASAEEALAHEFLAPCHESLRQQLILSSPTI